MNIKNGLLILGALVAGTVIADVSMEFKNIGFSGNSADDTGYGAVSYDFQIGKYEVTADQWATAIADDANVGNAGSWSGSQASGGASWFEAAKFCNWMTSGDAYSGAYNFDGTGTYLGTDRAAALGSHTTVYVLPTINEWYKAAYYNGGSSAYHTYANAGDSLPVAGTDVNYTGVNAAPWGVGSGTVELNGTFDMMGNVFEWSETDDPDFANNKEVGGGYWDSFAVNIRSGGITQFNSTTEATGLGFRVAAIPEPGTISLMSISTLGLFLTRNIRRRRSIGRSIIPVRRENLCDTFSSVEELRAARDERTDDVESGLAQLVVDALTDRVVFVSSKVAVAIKHADVSFWDFMVKRREKSVAKRVALKASMKKRALNSFDAFLALLLK